jgi:hypothetical protein
VVASIGRVRDRGTRDHHPYVVQVPRHLGARPVRRLRPRPIRYRDTKRHRIRFTPLLIPLEQDLREWFLVTGRPSSKQPVFPAHDGGFWRPDDWRNW